MNKFLVWGYTTSQNDIHLPHTEEEFQHVLGRYEMVGLPGCIGSIDCVHLIWTNCPVVITSQCKGKEKFPTLAFQVVVSHTRKILSCSPAFYGSVNDKTICRYDKVVSLMKKRMNTLIDIGIVMIKMATELGIKVCTLFVMEDTIIGIFSCLLINTNQMEQT